LLSAGIRSRRSTPSEAPDRSLQSGTPGTRWRGITTGSPPRSTSRLADQSRLAQWRIDNHIDVETIIRKIRDTEPI